MAIPEYVRHTMYHKDHNFPSEFRGPVCPAWDIWWQKIARSDSISSEGRIYASSRQVAQVYKGQVIGHKEIFGREHKFVEKIVIIKNHQAAKNFEDLIGVRNGMIVIDDVVLTLEVVGKKFFALRAANVEYQQELRNFYNLVTRAIDKNRIPSWKN